MRYKRWLYKEPFQDIDRICANHPESEAMIRTLANWIIDQLAEDPHEKGETRISPDGKIIYKRWVVGPLTVIFRLLPAADQTVILQGFIPSR